MPENTCFSALATPLSLSATANQTSPSGFAALPPPGPAIPEIATLSRASVNRNKWAVEVRAKVEAAAADVRKLAAGAGVSEETLAAIDARLQGVV